MCGLYAHLSKKKVDSDTIASITKSLSHRGPDGSGSKEIVSNNHFSYLIHTRLAILDVDHGDQPLSSNEGHLHLVYNGEVYNHNEIRKELEGLGYSFRTKCDTEVVLKSYLEWGEECLPEI